MFGRDVSDMDDAMLRLHRVIGHQYPGNPRRYESEESRHPQRISGNPSRRDSAAASVFLGERDAFGTDKQDDVSKKGSPARSRYDGAGLPVENGRASAGPLHELCRGDAVVQQASRDIKLGPTMMKNLKKDGADVRADHARANASSFHEICRGPAESQQAMRDAEHNLPKDDGEEPQNGRTAWLHALTGFLVVANCWGIGNAWGIFQAYYELFYIRGTPPSSIAWIGSTQLALVFGLGFPVGKLVDMGYFHTVFHTGSFLMVLGIFCTAWCKSLATLWVTQGLITGIGMGCLFCSGSKYAGCLTVNCN